MIFARLTEVQLDALKEISNIGMGHAATGLSQLIGETVYLRVPRVTVTDIAQVSELVGGDDKVVVGITLQIQGDARGNILLLFPAESAHRLLSCLLGHGEKALIMNDISSSALKEVANILASAYLNALGSLLHMTLIPSIPLLSYDMAGAVVDSVLIELSRAGDMALMVETEFHGDTTHPTPIKGHFLLLPDPHSLEIIFRAVGAQT